MATYYSTSLIELIHENYIEMQAGIHSFVCNGQTYSAQVTVWKDTIINGTVYVPSSTDGPMCVLIVRGDLVINSGGLLTPQNRCKGFFVVVCGNITNNGTISMTSRGASGTGQDVYLYKDGGSWHYVPAVGASGASSVRCRWGRSGYSSPCRGSNGWGRRTGGGARGEGSNWMLAFDTSAGGSGTSWSGGAGGGVLFLHCSITPPRNWENNTWGSSTGGAGGVSWASWDGAWAYYMRGGVGNPGGWGYGRRKGGKNYSYSLQQASGTGGLLIIYANNIYNRGSIEAKGTAPLEETIGGVDVYCGGGSGGGSINIYYTEGLANWGSISAAGQYKRTWSLAGGDGSVSWSRVLLPLFSLSYLVKVGDKLKYLQSVDGQWLWKDIEV